MKKKMALFMAAIMALSPVSAFASTSNRMDGTITTTKEKTALMERTWMNNNGSPNGRDILDLIAPNYSSDKIEYTVQGSDLVITANTDQIKAGDTFTVTLNNAEWVFANDDDTPYDLTNAGADIQDSIEPSLAGKTEFEKNVDKVYQAFIASYMAAAVGNARPGGTTKTPLNPNDWNSSTWDGETTTPADTSYAAAVRLWNLAEQYTKATYVEQGFSVDFAKTEPLDTAMMFHNNTKGYSEKFSSLITLPNVKSEDNSPFNDRFKSGALSYISGQTTPSFTNGYTKNNFDKALGALTGYDAGAYLRFGEVDSTTLAAAQGNLAIPAFAYNANRVPTAAVIEAQIQAIPGAAATVAALAGVTTTENAVMAADIATLYPGTELPYMMRFTGTADRKVATVTVLRDSYYPVASTSDASYIRIPMVVRYTGTGDATVSVAPSNNNTITAVTYTIGKTGDGKTKTTAEDVVTSRSTFELENIRIAEDLIGTMKSGKFYLTAPYGYTFADPTNSGYEIDMSSSGGLRYNNNAGVYTEILAANKKGVIKYYVENGTTLTNKLEFDLSGNGSTSAYGIERFDSIAGTLYIKNLILLAEDYAPFDKDVFLKITNGGANVTEEEFKVAVRKDWLIKLTASQPIPTLVNGRYAYEYKDKAHNVTLTDDVDGWHKTSKVTFEENVLASWWEERETTLTLPEGVKYIKVEIKDASGSDEFEFKSGMGLNGVYTATTLEGKRDGYVKVAGNVLTLTDLKLREGKKAKFTIQPWVSIESGFEGDITMTAGGTGVPYEIAPVVIAKAVSPITIDTEVTDVKIGYQWQKVADFTINETGAGRLLKDKTMTISIDDSISKDEIFFAPDSVVEKSGNISFTKPSVVGGNIELTIDRASNGTAGAIKFSNVYVKIDRTVPESNNHPYKIVATGNAIAANYVGNFKENSTAYSAYEPLFSTRGIGADYLNVVTAATDKPGVLSNTVRVSIGSDVVLVGRDNPQEIKMDTAAYISAESNSTMVPVRFVSVALGIPDGQIQWDNENRTVTINYTNTTVQMKAGSDQLTINGITTTMYSPDQPPKKVTVEMKDDRSFLPFRQLGYALGVPVSWDDETRTAIYNAPEDLNTSSSVVADAE